MTTPNFDKRAAEILDWWWEGADHEGPVKTNEMLETKIAAALREMYEQGVKDTELWMQMGWA